MRHENHQIGNLFLSVQIMSISDLGLYYNPNPNVNKKEDLLNFINKQLPSANLAIAHKVGTVIQIKELKELKGVKALVIIGTAKTGNVVLYIDQRIFDRELTMSGRHPMYVDRIRSVVFSNGHSKRTQGRLGEIYRRYSEAASCCIEDERFEDLRDISFVSMIHDFTLTGKIPDLSNTFG